MSIGIFNEILSSVVETVVSSFKKHFNGIEVNAVEALNEFWQLKMCNIPCKSVIQYDFELTGPPYVCFVTLPGGCCFGSFEICSTLESSKQSAAKVALTHCVLNEHSLNTLNPSTINQIISKASSSFCSSTCNFQDSPIDILRSVLNNHVGQSFLSFQETMLVFQLLFWNGNLKAIKQQNCSREEILNYYMCRGIDDNLTLQMAHDWANKERLNPGFLFKNLQKEKLKIIAVRQSGHELRFHKEKLCILQKAVDLLEFNL